MNQYRADLHVHTVLSPCGSLDMSPVNIIEAALEAKLDILAITDHNSTRQAPLVRELGLEAGIFVLCGAEVNTREDVHVLALFETSGQLEQFQIYLDQYLVAVKNKPGKFGYQVVVDRNDMIVYEEERLLISALSTSIDDIEKKVHALNGLFIPAHVDRMMNGIISHLGFIPENLNCDAFGLSCRANIEEWRLKLPKTATILQNSDAHSPQMLGNCFNVFEMAECTFDEVRKALKGEEGRKAYPASYKMNRDGQ